MIRRMILVLSLVAWASSAAQLTLKWNELRPQIEGKKIDLVLPGGTSVQGKVRGVSPTGMQLDISKSSDKKVQPKGLHTIPRQSVSFLRVTEFRKIGRILCTVGALAAAGGLVAYAAGNSDTSEGALVIALPAAGVVGTAGVGVGGYFFGKAIDKRVTEIRVAPGE